MKIGIIAAMPEELIYLIQHLDNAKEETVLGNSYHTGNIGSVELVLVESGIGKVNNGVFDYMNWRANELFGDKLER